MRKSNFLFDHFFSIIIIVFIFLTTYHLYLKVELKKEFKSGFNDIAIIIEQPSNRDAISTKLSFIKLLYNGKVYPMKIGPGFKHLGEEKIQVRVSKNKKDLFLLNEDFDGDIWTSSIMLLILLFCLYKTF